MKTKKILFWIFCVLALATNVLIIVMAAIPSNESANQSLGFTKWFISIIEKIDPNSPIVTNIEVTHAVLRKLVGHFGLFGVSGVFTSLTILFYKDVLVDKKFAAYGISMAFGLVFAFVSELVQLVTPGRAFAITDVCIDYSGYIIFGGLVFLVAGLVMKSKEKKNVSTLG